MNLPSINDNRGGQRVTNLAPQDLLPPKKSKEYLLKINGLEDENSFWNDPFWMDMLIFGGGRSCWHLCIIILIFGRVVTQNNLGFQSRCLGYKYPLETKKLCEIFFIKLKIDVAYIYPLGVAQTLQQLFFFLRRDTY